MLWFRSLPFFRNNCCGRQVPRNQQRRMGYRMGVPDIRSTWSSQKLSIYELGGYRALPVSPNSTDRRRRPCWAAMKLSRFTRRSFNFLRNCMLFARSMKYWWVYWVGMMLFWGTQQSPLISPAIFREIFKPRYETLMVPIHRGGNQGVRGKIPQPPGRRHFLPDVPLAAIGEIVVSNCNIRN